MPSRPEGAPPVTLTAVARRARVSIATASYVLNGIHQSRIPIATQARVQEAARELGYVPNESARSLRTGRSSVVIVHVAGGMPMLERAALALDRLGASLRSAGYTLLLHYDGELRGTAAAQRWCAMRPRAVIAELALLTEASVRLLTARGIHVLGVGPRTATWVPTLLLDDSSLGETAVRHLIARGCRRIALILPREPWQRTAAAHRLAGARRAAARRPGVKLHTVEMALDAADALRLATRWKSRDRPDGVFGASDMYCAALLSALADRGIGVPDEIAVIGADDSPVCRVVRPRLSSVGIELDSIERSLVEPVLAAVRGDWNGKLARRSWTARLQVRDT